MSATIPSIRALDVDSLSAEYDLFIATIGYEDRATFIPKTYNFAATEKLAIGFIERRVFAYEANREWYGHEKYSVEEPEERLFGDIVRSQIGRLNLTRTLRFCVDVSSMTRHRIAVLVDIFRDSSLPPIDVHFLYGVAAYSPAPKVPYVNRHVGPMLPSFAGWWTHPERRTVAVVGLGYEQNKALGAVEHLQVGEILLFVPTSSQSEYTKALELANATLFKEISRAGRFYYIVERPLDCFVELELLISSLLPDSNPILLPFGPKIFTLNSLLVAAVHREVAVWRVSGAEEPANRIATGEVTGVSAHFENCRHLEDSLDAVADSTPSR